MLGPSDLRDWDFDEADLVRAEIRVHPRFRACVDAGRGMSRLVGANIAGRIAAFERGEGHELADLRRLLRDIENVGSLASATARLKRRARPWG